ncbi:SMP-30/gluconolactonase/LRE family protein [Epibacterium sp. Ofav1-8]|uniref:SMP-30/gluconolactonase/LRE family protein n=1 Tax=Epibacterium sp. Ofav1-8 TaxID=2917735 RepID=UPI001EF518B5|nr:SMP-30/gluconolactonase/LRE family protein [Epibacterium sp. Ofav1-8]MCG7625088.1 SMP-30/gluconolactonase/LRE family protein [Epibacterium sp. Ofav1-8]
MAGLSAAADAILMRHLGRGIDDLVSEGGAKVIARDLAWSEGPCWCPGAGQWIFSDIPNNRVLSYSAAYGLGLFRAPAQNANGHFATAGGTILCCEHLSRSVTRQTPDGQWQTLCDSYGGGRLNSPNDVIEAWDGAVWFTDPTYGILTDYEGARAEAEQAQNRVYRIAPDGTVSAEIADLKMPNGLSISAERRWIYVADSGADMGPEVAFDAEGPRDVFRYALSAEGRVAGRGQPFCRVLKGVPDGIRTAPEGGLWVASGAGLERFDATGARLGCLAFDKPVANFASGGEGDDEILITASDAVIRITKAE